VLPHLVTLSFGYRSSVLLVLSAGATPSGSLGRPAAAPGSDAPGPRDDGADAVILDCARTRGADLVAMVDGTGGGPLGGLALGPIAEAVVRHAPCPVMIARPE
jgi:nucleotide-binding universal stress UspA family protein